MYAGLRAHVVLVGGATFAILTGLSSASAMAMNCAEGPAQRALAVLNQQQEELQQSVTQLSKSQEARSPQEKAEGANTAAPSPGGDPSDEKLTILKSIQEQHRLITAIVAKEAMEEQKPLSDDEKEGVGLTLGYHKELLGKVKKNGEDVAAGKEPAGTLNVYEIAKHAKPGTMAYKILAFQPSQKLPTRLAPRTASSRLKVTQLQGRRDQLQGRVDSGGSGVEDFLKIGGFLFDVAKFIAAL